MSTVEKIRAIVQKAEYDAIMKGIITPPPNWGDMQLLLAAHDQVSAYAVDIAKLLREARCYVADWPGTRHPAKNRLLGRIDSALAKNPINGESVEGEGRITPNATAVTAAPGASSYPVSDPSPGRSPTNSVEPLTGRCPHEDSHDGLPCMECGRTASHSSGTSTEQEKP